MKFLLLTLAVALEKDETTGVQKVMPELIEYYDDLTRDFDRLEGQSRVLTASAPRFRLRRTPQAAPVPAAPPDVDGFAPAGQRRLRRSDPSALPERKKSLRSGRPPGASGSSTKAKPSPSRQVGEHSASPLASRQESRQISPGASASTPATATATNGARIPDRGRFRRRTSRRSASPPCFGARTGTP